MKIISKESINALGISASVCMEWIEESFRQKYEAQLPTKISLHPQGDDFFNTMPCLLPPSHHRFAVKIVNRIAGNNPSLHSDILLYDSRTGELLALLDGDWVTTMRTGAVAALSARLFQRNGTDTYSLMGLGHTARATVECIMADRNNSPTRFRLLRYKDQAECFIKKMKEIPGFIGEIVDTTAELVAGADVLISCITAASDLICPDDSLYREGMLLIPVHTRGFQNCDLFFDKVFADDRGHVCGFHYFDRFRHFDELSRVLLGQAQGRTSPQERILCYNIGIGLHDAVFANHLYELTVG
ncbi:MAG: ornithine cyclodeaminase [Bacteroidales bacterium]|nr:ornithine cyclodeaminase [Bacteroidales bacterium]